MEDRNGDMPSEEESGPDSPQLDGQDNDEVGEQDPLDQPKSVLKKSEPLPEIKRPELPEQPDPSDLDTSTLTPLSPEIIARQGGCAPALDFFNQNPFNPQDSLNAYTFSRSCIATAEQFELQY